MGEMLAGSEGMDVVDKWQLNKYGLSYNDQQKGIKQKIGKVLRDFAKKC